MADFTWLDTNTLILVSNGDVALEGELKKLPGKLLIVPKVQEEARTGNPFKTKTPNMRPELSRTSDTRSRPSSKYPWEI